MPRTRSEVTRLLQAWRGGDLEARDQLIPLVFEELRGIARRQLKLEAPNHTLQPTAVVNELYLLLVDQNKVQWEGRKDFFAIAANLIRRILVDHARKRRAAKRAGWGLRVSFEEAQKLPAGDADLIALDEALKDFARVDQRSSRVVELHIFGGRKLKEIANLLKVSRSTVIRDWNHAKLWLSRELDRK